MMTNAAQAASGATEGSEGKAAFARRFPGEPSMWFFIVGDLLIFGVYFVFYMIYRGQNPELFLQSQQNLDVHIGVINTVILLTSSLFVALGLEAARERKTRDGVRLLSLAFFLGAVFPFVKMAEWIPKIGAGMTPGENLFFMFYYVMTGVHLAHVLLGLVIMGFMIYKLRVSRKPDIKFLETGAIYWHMVDLLWLVLLALFYLMR